MVQKWLHAIIAGVRNWKSRDGRVFIKRKKNPARKTKCDGGHPTCSSCARRSLTCNYVNDPNAPGGPRRKGSAAASEPVSAVSSGPVSAGPSSAPASASGYHMQEDDRMERERDRERVENQPPSKRIRVEGGSTASAVAVLGIP
jgi:Zn(2)-Cys(6) binuclear cluster domain-containing protein